MRQKTRKKNGGKVIDSGGFGCVFKPALKCKTAKHRTKGISKLGSSQDVNIEWEQLTKIKNLLKKIPNYKDYFLLSDITKCSPSKLTVQDKINFNKCQALARYGITVDTINQHLDENVILIEVGAQVNTLEEAKYTAKLLGESVATYLIEK